MKAKQSAYLICFILTLVLFGAANIIDQIVGQPEFSKSYPFFIFMVWTAVVATFLFLGWKTIFIVNAIVLYAVQTYTVIYHAPTLNPTSLQWLIGSLPFPNKYMIFIPVLFLVSLIYQYIAFLILRKNDGEEYEYDYDYEDEEDDKEQKIIQVQVNRK
jgi:hypothetical protein